MHADKHGVMRLGERDRHIEEPRAEPGGRQMDRNGLDRCSGHGSPVQPRRHARGTAPPGDITGAAAAAQTPACSRLA